MKVFLAIDPSAALQKEIARQMMPISNDYQEFSWIAPEKYHITVQYIGDVDGEEKLQHIKPIVEELTYDVPGFTLYSNMANILIDSRITLYVDFQKNNHLEVLVKRLQESLGIVPKYRYMPHITLAKYKIPSKQQYQHLKKKLHKLELDIEIPVTSITLYESIISGTEPTYKKITEFPLATS